ncbi:MAG: trypsin-like peptidase domain-containing protein [Elusimicrobiota bacterium]
MTSLFAVLLAGSVHGQRAVELQDSFAAVAAKAKPAVVNITAVHEERPTLHGPHFFFGDPEDMARDFLGGPRRRWRYEGTGSGVIVDPRGYVVTNEHVVRGASGIKITLTGLDGKQRTLKGSVVARDAAMDLALVKIQEAAPFPALALGDSDKLRVGDWVLAIGSPFQLQQSVTAGIVSAIRQSLLIEGQKYHNLIQTDAAINRGNSGGPLIGLRGEVVGINTAIYSPSGASAGIGFAVAANEVKDFVEPILEGRAARRGWLGVELAPLDDVMRRKFGLRGEKGAIVNVVVQGGPAEKTLRRGDVIQAVDGVEVEDAQDAARHIRRTPPGRTVALAVSRGGRRTEVRVALAERPEWLGSAPSTVVSETSVSTAAAAVPEPKKGWHGVEFEDSKEGVRVKRVEPDSALFGYLLEGDIVKGVNQHEVSSLAGFEKLAAGLALPEGVVFDILRRGQAMYISAQSSE